MEDGVSNDGRIAAYQRGIADCLDALTEMNGAGIAAHFDPATLVLHVDEVVSRHGDGAGYLKTMAGARAR